MSAPLGVPPEVPTYAELRQSRDQGAVVQRRLLSLGFIAIALVVYTSARNRPYTEAIVKSHVNQLLPKIGARDRAQAVSYAHRRGITGA